jgi:hypothetical protein
VLLGVCCRLLKLCRHASVSGGTRVVFEEHDHSQAASVCRALPSCTVCVIHSVCAMQVTFRRKDAQHRRCHFVASLCFLS